MSKFCIRQLTVSGKNRTPSTVDFGDGLNIIYGVSDTGKSCILNCIDFAFGKSEGSPVPEKYGYSVVRLSLRTERGTVDLERKIGERKIFVISQDPRIPSGGYDLLKFGKMILGLLGINGQPKIIKNSRYEQVSLTWRTILQAFLISEDEISQSEPILLPRESTTKTSFLSGLLYLIEAPDCSEFDPKKDKKMREVREKAIETYVTDELKKLDEQHEKLRNTLNQSKNFPDQDLHKLTENLSFLKAAIANEANHQKGLLSEMFVQQDRLAECELLLARYEELRSQYGSDIKRLSFIVDGEQLLNEVPIPEQCPFCHGELPKSEQVSYVEAANAELARITKLLSDLEETEKTVAEDKRGCEKKLRELELMRSKSEKLLKQELQPKADQLGKELDHYRKLIETQKEIDMIEKLRQEKIQYLKKMSVEGEAVKTEYRPREHFPPDFEDCMTKSFHRILGECKYENLVSSRFFLKDFDVWVNGQPKRNFGQGHKAFLNTVLAITLREYLCTFGKYPFGLLMIDSPLLSLEQGVKDAAPESMKAALMEYLMKTQDFGQTILIENNIPDLDYSSFGVTLHHFTKGKTGGRYGLLADITE